MENLNEKQTYRVMVDDNFHYMDADERYMHGEYKTLEEAIKVCKRITEESLMSFYKPGMTKDKLLQYYYCFGDDPWVGGGTLSVPFSAWNYVIELASKIKPESITEKAAKIAIVAHKDQLRKGDNLPYIIHPFMVALKLAKYNFSDTIIAAALVHDVLEDTNYPEEDLHTELGDEVMEIVKAVTNDSTLSWEEKKIKYVETVRSGPEGARAVSVADKIHNLESLFQAYSVQGPKVWKNFNRGKEKKIWFENEVLKMLKETWEHPLIAEYERLLEQAKNLKEENNNS